MPTRLIGAGGLVASGVFAPGQSARLSGLPGKSDLRPLTVLRSGSLSGLPGRIPARLLRFLDCIMLMHHSSELNQPQVQTDV